jgi:hypothetical protein
MGEKEQMLAKLKLEIEIIERNPIFEEYQKLDKIINIGLYLKKKHQKFVRDYQMINGSDEQEDEDDVEIPPPKPSQIVPKMRLKERPAVSPERERELDKKVQQVTKKQQFEARPEELGQDEPELPDVDLDD